MTARLNPMTAAPSLMKAWHGASVAIASSIEAGLRELVEVRASQINGCANCVNMHTLFARENGETEQRLYLLAAWREAPCYTPRERAALAWTDALTKLSDERSHDLLAAAQAALAEHFDAEEQVKLTLLINVINGRNRIAIGFGMWIDMPMKQAA